MERVALTLLLAAHGALHVLGFVKAWNPGALPQLTGRTLTPLSGTMTRAVGLLWLLAAGAFLVAATYWWSRHPSWWRPAAAAALLSQALIVCQWHDAKAGTLPNLLIGVAVVLAAARARFDDRVDREAGTLFAASVMPVASPLRSAELAPLPVPVRRWLEACGAVGRERATAVRLRQRGWLRTGPGQAWMPAEAEQYFSVDPAAFVWKVRGRLKGIPVAGRDLYSHGRGHMLILAGSLVRVVDAADEKIAESALLRWLAEIVWFPSAAVSPAIAWEPIDALNARATVTDHGVTASALFSFDERGRVTRLTARRFLGGGEAAVRHDWTVPVRSWRVVRGVEIPVEGDVIWRLPAGDFNYYRWEVLDVECNRPQPYPTGRDAGAAVSDNAGA